MNTSTKTNGVDTTALFAALDEVKAQPEAAKFQFRATNQWQSGTHSMSTIHGFFGLGAEQMHREAHTYDADHPLQLVGTDIAPSPVEFLLHALAACITAGIGNVAAARGIQLTRVESTVNGDIDLVGLLAVVLVQVLDARLDLACLDPVAVQRDLTVGPPDEADLAVELQQPLVAGAVDPVPRLAAERVGHEALGGE